MLIGGVDEAGRGPVIGPMVLALAIAEENKIEELKELKVRDSKELSLKRREALYPKIKRILDEVVVVKVQPAEIDQFVEGRGGLNELEAFKTAELLSTAKKQIDVIYVDAPDPNPLKYAQRIEKYLNYPPKIVAENKADAKYPIVSAASIIAKVERDWEIKKIEEKYGEFGTGYPHDEKTIQFLKTILKGGKPPEFVRTSWSTVKRLLNRNILEW